METPEEIEKLADKKYQLNFIRWLTGFDKQYILDKYEKWCEQWVETLSTEPPKRRTAPFKDEATNLVWENGYQMCLLDKAEEEGKKIMESTSITHTRSMSIEEIREMYPDFKHPAIEMLRQRLRDMKALDNAGVINKSVFQGFDYAVKQTEEYLESLNKKE